MKMLNDLHKQMVALICAFDGIAPASKANCKPSAAMRQVRARFRMGDEGSNLVEFAVMLPLLIMFLTGIFSVGLAFVNQQALMQAVGIGAQQLANSRTTSKDPCAEVFNAIKATAPTLVPSKINLTTTFNDSGDQPGSTCQGSVGKMNSVQPGVVTVKASYLCPFSVVGVNIISSSCVASATEFEY